MNMPSWITPDELRIIFIGGAIGLGVYLYLVIPKSVKIWLNYKFQDVKDEDIPKDLDEDWKYKKRGWKFWK